MGCSDGKPVQPETCDRLFWGLENIYPWAGPSSASLQEGDLSLAPRLCASLEVTQRCRGLGGGGIRRECERQVAEREWVPSGVAYTRTHSTQRSGTDVRTSGVDGP